MHVRSSHTRDRIITHTFILRHDEVLKPGKKPACCLRCLVCTYTGWMKMLLALSKHEELACVLPAEPHFNQIAILKGNWALSWALLAGLNVWTYKCSRGGRCGVARRGT